MRFLLAFLLIITVASCKTTSNEAPAPEIKRNITSEDVRQYYKDDLTYKTVTVNIKDSPNSKAPEKWTVINEESVKSWLNEFVMISEKEAKKLDKNLRTAREQHLADILKPFAIVTAETLMKPVNQSRKFISDMDAEVHNVELIESCGYSALTNYVYKVDMTFYGKTTKDGEVKEAIYEDTNYLAIARIPSKFNNLPLKAAPIVWRTENKDFCNKFYETFATNIFDWKKSPMSQSKITRKTINFFDDNMYIAISDNVIHFPDNISDGNMMHDAMLLGGITKLTRDLDILSKEKSYGLKIKLQGEPKEVVGCNTATMISKNYQWRFNWNTEITVEGINTNDKIMKPLWFNMTPYGDNLALTAISDTITPLSCTDK